MKKHLRVFLSALRFLTVLPVPWLAEKDSEHFTKAAVFFPIIGLLIGVIGYIIGTVGLLFLPFPLLCAFFVLFLSGFSGFLHLDGLADTADGFLSYRPLEQKLEIMQDSRVGAMGVITLVGLLLVKFTALLSVPPSLVAYTILCLPVAGRCSIIFLMLSLPYAKGGGGLGKLFYPGKRVPVILSLFIVVLLMGTVVNTQFAFLTFVAMSLASVTFGYWCKKAIGGVTGDTLGAVCEISETLTAVILAIFINL